MNFKKQLILLALVSFTVRLLFAFFLPLDGHDETYDILISQKPIFETLRATVSLYPPVWTLVLRFLEKISTNYFFLRIAPALLGSLSVILIGILAKRLFNTKVAIISALIFTLSPTQIYYAASLRLYAFSVLISILIFLAFLNFLKTDSRGSRLKLLISLVAGNYTYYLFPILGLCLAIFILLERKLRAEKLRSFLITFVASLVLTIPLYIFFLRVEPVSKNILPAISLTKVLALPISYSFPLNLAELTHFYPQFELNYLNILLLLFSLLSIGILVKNLRLKNRSLLWITLIGAPLATLLLSFAAIPAFALRSLLIFSVPFYLLVGDSLGSPAKILSKLYISFASIVVLMLLASFIQRATPATEVFLKQKVLPGSLMLHTEFTTYTYYSYLFPELQNSAAIDSLYVNIANKKVLGYVPVDPKTLAQKRFWLLEYPSQIHRQQVANFKEIVLKTHNQVNSEDFGEVKILQYDPK